MPTAVFCHPHRATSRALYVALYAILHGLLCGGGIGPKPTWGEVLKGIPGRLSAEQVEFFEKRIRPVLVEHCYECHAGRGDHPAEGGLRLDSAEGLARGGASGPALSEDDPNASLLLQALRHDGPAMPPDQRLPEAVIADFQQWIELGAPDPRHAPSEPSVDVARSDRSAPPPLWSLQAIGPVRLPTVADTDWPRNRVDTFILAKLEDEQLRPATAASPAAWLRRASFDLRGLPPDLHDWQMCDQVATWDPAARERWGAEMVDRWLTSPEYGERWGRVWLDLARYADETEDWVPIQGSAYLYRDWVVDSLNRDLAYPQFVRLQLAADLLPHTRPADRAALGFLGLGPQYWKELSLAPEVIRRIVADEWDERIDTVCSTFLGLTVACARCHDHKFDPITMSDYYALAGVFASTQAAAQPVLESVPDPQRLTAAGVKDAALQVLPDGPHRTRLVTEEGRSRDLAIFLRGNPEQLGPLVPRRFLSAFAASQSYPFGPGSGRADLAHALFRDAASLLARVMVNRVWLEYFGRGLVDTPSNFGRNGDPPSHPELLDDLAWRFMQHGWSLKWLHREIVLSATYGQASRPQPMTATYDPANLYVGRMARKRLPIEAWRDAMLTVSGELQRQMGGPSRSLGDPTHVRRTLYGTVRRTELHEMLRLHDFPSADAHSPRRMPTTTPLQQLFVLNSPMLLARSQALAQRLERESPDPTLHSQLTYAYRLAFGRQPSAAESRRAEQYMSGHAPNVRSDRWCSLLQALLASNEFMYVD